MAKILLYMKMPITLNPLLTIGYKPFLLKELKEMQKI